MNLHVHEYISTIPLVCYYFFYLIDVFLVTMLFSIKFSLCEESIYVSKKSIEAKQNLNNIKLTCHINILMISVTNFLKQMIDILN